MVDPHRKAAALTQESLADCVDIDRTYVSSLGRCICAASIDLLDRAAKALNVEAAELLRRPDRAP